jgi:hypothetical protein
MFLQDDDDDDDSDNNILKLCLKIYNVWDIIWSLKKCISGNVFVRKMVKSRLFCI